MEKISNVLFLPSSSQSRPNQSNQPKTATSMIGGAKCASVTKNGEMQSPTSNQQKSVDELLVQARAEREKFRPHVEELYGELSESNFIEAVRAIKQTAECEGCTGTCQKTSQRWHKPIIRKNEDGSIYVNSALCNYGQIRYEQSEFRRSGIPEKFCDKTLTDFKKTAENQGAMDVFRRVIYPKADEAQKGAYFYGETGTGKTFMASLIAQEFVRDFRRVIFRDMPSLLTEIKATFDNRTPMTTADFLESVCDCDLLVLDDLGAEKVTEWSVEQLYSIVNQRYNAGKILVATANFDLDGLQNRLGGDITAKRITSRLREMTSQAFFGTQDWRK